jgi:orotate phosphoribosyltransferase
MNILQTTGAYRRGHFIYPNGKHASHYFQMPLAFRFYDNARILSVGLSRLFPNGEIDLEPASESLRY